MIQKSKFESPSSSRKKLKFENNEAIASFFSPQLNVATAPKYGRGSVFQNERYYFRILLSHLFIYFKLIYFLRFYKLVSMLVKCMLPISLVDNNSFREYITFLDPSFSMPTRKRIKDTALPTLKDICLKKNKEVLSNIEMVNICTDLWTDSTARPFNGFIAQGIDNEWKLQTLPIEFEYIEGIKLMLCLVSRNL